MNIRSWEIDKMVGRTKVQRKKQLDRPIRFRRRQGGGQFHHLPHTKVTLHEERVDADLPSSVSSHSSGL